MAGEDSELCGFLDAKLPGGRCSVQRVKKRSLAPWKVWRRHWCSTRKLGPGQGLEVLLDHGVGSNQLNSQVAADKDNCIRIPGDAIVCRTESRTKPYAFGVFPARERKPLVYLAASSETESQRWMSNLRQTLRPRRHRHMDGSHVVSMVDNAHSRSAGLTGLYGDLIASRSGIFIKDVHTGDIVETFEWKETHQYHLATSGSAEDVKRVVVIHTTKEFRGGVGELHVFCLNAPRLLQDLVTQGRGPRHNSSSSSSSRCSSNSKHLNQRPISLSEGDLRTAAQKELSESPNQGFQSLKHKIAANIVNAGLGLLMSTRSGSEAKLLNEYKTGILEKLPADASSPSRRRAVDNVYQPEPANTSGACCNNNNSIMSSLEELEEPSLRRVSSISVGSGIYEEIKDDYVSRSVAGSRRPVPSHLYEDPGELLLSSSVRPKPPPLPPRQRCLSGPASDDGLDSEGGTTTRSTSPSTQDDATPTPPESTCCGPIDTSEYVSMSPRLRDIALSELHQQNQQENIYMVMR